MLTVLILGVPVLHEGLRLLPAPESLTCAANGSGCHRATMDARACHAWPPHLKTLRMHGPRGLCRRGASQRCSHQKPSTCPGPAGSPWRWPATLAHCSLRSQGAGVGLCEQICVGARLCLRDLTRANRTCVLCGECAPAGREADARVVKPFESGGHPAGSRDRRRGRAKVAAARHPRSNIAGRRAVARGPRSRSIAGRRTCSRPGIAAQLLWQQWHEPRWPGAGGGGLECRRQQGGTHPGARTLAPRRAC